MTWATGNGTEPEAAEELFKRTDGTRLDVQGTCTKRRRNNPKRELYNPKAMQKLRVVLVVHLPNLQSQSRKRWDRMPSAFYKRMRETPTHIGTGEASSGKCV